VEQFGGMGEKEARELGQCAVDGARGKLVGIGDVDWCGVRLDSSWVYWVTGFSPCLL